MTDKDNLKTALDLLRTVSEDASKLPGDTAEAIDEFIDLMETPVVKVQRDLDPSNPFTDFDCEVPILVAYLDHARYSMHEYGVEDHLPFLPDEVMREHEAEIRESIGSEFDEEPIEDLRAEFETYYHEQTAEERLDLLEKVYGWLGITAYVGSSTGYAQGDYALVLAVATPEWVEKVGAPQASLQSQCEATVKLYGWWAWGDAWGYTIETRSGEHIDSCWGFFGDSLDETGMLDNVEGKYLEALKDAWERRFE